MNAWILPQMQIKLWSFFPLANHCITYTQFEFICDMNYFNKVQAQYIRIGGWRGNESDESENGFFILSNSTLLLSRFKVTQTTLSWYQNSKASMASKKNLKTWMYHVYFTTSRHAHMKVISTHMCTCTSHFVFFSSIFF